MPRFFPIIRCRFDAMQIVTELAAKLNRNPDHPNKAQIGSAITMLNNNWEIVKKNPIMHAKIAALL